MRIKTLLLWLVFVVGMCGKLPVHASELMQDSIRISLVTCAPGSEIFALFGHTAIRYENYTRRQDLVFNYGMFSFNTPNFVMRFLMGKTDYQLGVVPYSHFEMEYAMRGSDVYQQVLNLTQEEKVRLVMLLDENYHPSNRTYRYNYFYDNCTTRARDKIEECLNGTVSYPEDVPSCSFRDIIHEFTAGNAWSELGIDLCLGAEADVPLDYRKQQFAPFKMLSSARKATLSRSESVTSYIESEHVRKAEVIRDHSEGFPLSPLACAIILLGITLTVAVWSYKVGRVCWLWDVLLYGLQGLGGCIIAFLFFFSVHPTVGSNWMLVLFNPLPLCYLPMMVYKAVKRKKDFYHALNVVYLTLFIIAMPFIPQYFNATVLPLTLSLLVCSAGHLFLYRSKRFK